MGVTAKKFWSPRKGNTPEEYEDACAANPASGRYAVADGATEGCFTGLWARLLVDDFVGRSGQGMESWPSSLSAIQAQWDGDVVARNLPYHAEPWVRRGAYAAFLGVVLTDSHQPSEGEPGMGTTVSPSPVAGAEPGVGTTVSPRPLAGEGQGVRAIYRWQAIAVGDTCLFHTRGNALIRAFPLEDSQQFNNAPKLVGARTSTEVILQRCLVWRDGHCQPGDRLWLMTDALAEWCLSEAEAGGNPWAELESLLNCQVVSSAADRCAVSGREDEGGPFVSWINELRRTRRLRNDDVTLLALLFQE
jgi:hypothetical protein